MKLRPISLFTISLFSFASFAQNNSVVIRDNAFIVINGGTAGNEAVLVVDQAHANGIVTSGTGGNIITQGEFDYVKWNIGTSTGNYTLPFTTDVGSVKIPLSINVTGAGTGGGYLALSTWDVSNGGGSFNNTPYPSEVIHMSGANGQADVSEYTVDRFWIIDNNDPLGTGEVYSADPSVTMSFDFNPSAAETGDGNSLAIGNLGAQHYDGSVDKWFGWFSAGSPNAIYGTSDGVNTVSGVTPPSGHFHRTWTLQDYDEPLPVELNFFDGDCESEGTVLSWQTESELNSEYFNILKSTNGVDFSAIATIPSSGNSNSTTDYSFVDEESSSTDNYYKLVQVDFDGSEREYDVLKTSPCKTDNGFNVFSQGQGSFTLEYDSKDDQEVNVMVYDVAGKLIFNPQQKNLHKGYNRIKIDHKELAFGSYMIVMETSVHQHARPLIIQ